MWYGSTPCSPRFDGHLDHLPGLRSLILLPKPRPRLSANASLKFWAGVRGCTQHAWSIGIPAPVPPSLVPRDSLKNGEMLSEQYFEHPAPLSVTPRRSPPPWNAGHRRHHHHHRCRRYGHCTHGRDRPRHRRQPSRPTPPARVCSCRRRAFCRRRGRVGRRGRLSGRPLRRRVRRAPDDTGGADGERNQEEARRRRATTPGVEAHQGLPAVPSPSPPPNAHSLGSQVDGQHRRIVRYLIKGPMYTIASNHAK